MNIWSLKDARSCSKEEHEAADRQRDEFFKLIQPKDNWKDPIGCWIPADKLDDCNQAAIWFTGAPLTVMIVESGRVYVTGPGYYATIGA